MCDGTCKAQRIGTYEHEGVAYVVSVVLLRSGGRAGLDGSIHPYVLCKRKGYPPYHWSKNGGEHLLPIMSPCSAYSIGGCS